LKNLTKLETGGASGGGGCGGGNFGGSFEMASGSCGCGGGHSVSPNRDGSTHVTHHTDGAHVSHDVQKNGQITGWHGTIHDTTGKGQDIIVERKK